MAFYKQGDAVPVSDVYTEKVCTKCGAKLDTTDLICSDCKRDTKESTPVKDN